MGSQGRANCKGRCGNRGPPNMLEALSDFFDVESDWLCGKGENVRWCNELFLPTVTDTDCSSYVQGKEDAAEVFAKKHILSSCPRGPWGVFTVQERVCDRSWCRRHRILSIILVGIICENGALHPQLRTTQAPCRSPRRPHIPACDRPNRLTRQLVRTLCPCITRTRAREHRCPLPRHITAMRRRARPARLLTFFQRRQQSPASLTSQIRAFPARAPDIEYPTFDVTVFWVQVLGACA